MKIQFTPNPKISRIFFIAAVSLIGALIVILAIGTIYAFVRPPNSSPLFKLGKSAKTGTAGTVQQNGDIRVFSGMGRLRIPLSNASTMIISIAFPYSASDTAFTEELAAKIGELRTLASGYFSTLSAEEAANMDEETAKREILSRFNTNLRLGRIQELYFTDMVIIDGN